MKVLFLDFDGVITCTTASYESNIDDIFMPGKQYLDRACLTRLHEVIDVTGCSVVVSSSWRHAHSLEWLADFLEVPKGVVVGKTPGSGEIFQHDDTGRGTCITEWLAQHGKDVREWIAVDDDVFDMHPWMLPRIVQTESSTGLTEDCRDQSISLLGEKNPWWG